MPDEAVDVLVESMSKKAGFADHFTKPVDFSAIEAVLGRLPNITVGGSGVVP